MVDQKFNRICLAIGNLVDEEDDDEECDCLQCQIEAAQDKFNDMLKNTKVDEEDRACLRCRYDDVFRKVKQAILDL